MVADDRSVWIALCYSAPAGELVTKQIQAERWAEDLAITNFYRGDAVVYRVATAALHACQRCDHQKAAKLFCERFRRQFPLGRHSDRGRELWISERSAVSQAAVSNSGGGIVEGVGVRLVGEPDHTGGGPGRKT